MAQSNTTKRMRGQTTAHRAASGPRTTLMSPVEPVETAPAAGGLAPGGLASGGLAPGGVAPGGLAPGGLEPGGLAPGGLALGGLAPGGLAAGGVAPGGLAPGGLAPGGLAPGGLAPGWLAPGWPAPGGLAPGGLAPGGLAPNGLTPGAYLPGRPAPNGVALAASAPAGPAPAGAPSASPAISYTTTTPPAAQTPAFTPPPPAPAAQQLRFLMTSMGLPGIPRIGAAPSGEVLLTGRPGEGYAVAGTIYGLPALPDRSLSPTLWLLHDLTVPMDLSPGDLAALPRGNQPGLLFTQDGRPPSFGPQANVITIAVPVGIFEQSPEGSWQVHAQLTPPTNQTYHPLAALGPNELPDPNLPMPSGTMAALLTDLFLRPATLLPHLRVREQHPDRLRAICQLWGARPPQHLDGGAFTRVAVTLEGPVRSTPSRLPTQEALILWGNNRAQLS